MEKGETNRIAETPTPVTSSEHEARAFDMMLRLREMARSIEDFDFAGKGRRVKIANYAKLSEEFFELMAVACDTYPDIAAVAQLTGAEIRVGITAMRAYGAVAADMFTQARGMEDTVAELRGELGRRTLNAYLIARRLEKQVGPIPHLAAIRRALDKGRGYRARPKESEPAAAAKNEE